MVDRKKVQRYIMLLALILVLIIISLVIFTKNNKNNGTEISNSVEKSVTQFSKDSKLVDDDYIKEYVENINDFELNKDSINRRNDILKKVMTNSAFEQYKVSDESQDLIKLLEKYQNDKEIDTSNSIQLVDKKYISSKIFENISNKNEYYIEIRYDERPIYIENYSNMISKYIVKTDSSGKVSSSELIETKKV